MNQLRVAALGRQPIDSVAIPTRGRGNPISLTMSCFHRNSVRNEGFSLMTLKKPVDPTCTFKTMPKVK